MVSGFCAVLYVCGWWEGHLLTAACRCVCACHLPSAWCRGCRCGTPSWQCECRRGRSSCSCLGAASAADSWSYLYRNRKNFSIARRCKSPDPILLIDFSEDGTIIKGTSISRKLYYFTILGKQITEFSNAVKWHSYSSPVEPLIEGAQDSNLPGNKINSIAKLKNKNILAVGDDKGLVKLLRFPCIAKGIL